LLERNQHLAVEKWASGGHCDTFLTDQNYSCANLRIGAFGQTSPALFFALQSRVFTA
jgi:hypothetical protein